MAKNWRQVIELIYWASLRTMSVKWSPDEREEELIAAWFEDMDESSQGQLGGAKIVKFLMESGLEKGTLRHIWGVVDEAQRGWVDLPQFTVIIRLVSLAASPRFSLEEREAPSMQMYAETVTDRIPLPHSLIEACDATMEINKEIARERTSSMDRNTPGNRRPSGGESPGGRDRRNSGEKLTPTRRRSSGSGEKNSTNRRRSSGSKHKQQPTELEWLPSLEEEQKIAQWFAGLDADPQNGQVGGAKIVKFLMESGLEKGTLRNIWELVDTEKRGWVKRRRLRWRSLS